jgi:nitric oxide reductase large subunit
MNYSEIENWLQESKDRYSAFYKGSPSVVRMRLMLFFLRLIFGLVAIASGLMLLLSLFMNIGQSIADIFGLTDVPLYEEGKLSFLSIILGIMLAVSLFSLWLIKLVRRRNDHMSDLHKLLDTHFAEGEKLLDEYRHTIS